MSDDTLDDIFDSFSDKKKEKIQKSEEEKVVKKEPKKKKTTARKKKKEKTELEEHLEEKQGQSPPDEASLENSDKKESNTSVAVVDTKIIKMPEIITEDILRSIVDDEDSDIRVEEVDEEEDKTVYCIVADKGNSKTTLSMSFTKSELLEDDPRKVNGTVIACISLDRQSNKIAKKYRKAYQDQYPEEKGLVTLRNKAFKKSGREKFKYSYPEQLEAVDKWKKKYKNDPSKYGNIHTANGVKGIKEIHVWNGVHYYTTATSELKTLSGEATYIYILRLLDTVISKIRPDYIIIDDMEKLNVIAEMTMRKRNRIDATAGFKNRNLWKERNDYIDHVFGRCVEYAVVAPIFTTYFKLQEILDDDGEVVSVREPKWVDRIMKESNVVIKNSSKTVDNITEFFSIIKSAKDVGWRVKKSDIFTDYKGNGGINNLLSSKKIYTREDYYKENE